MPSFIEVDNKVININSISKIEFISDDIYTDLIPTDDDKKPIVDFVPFTFAQIELFDGEKVDLDIDLYWPEEEEGPEEWTARHRAYINQEWDELIGSLGKVTKITGCEYDF